MITPKWVDVPAQPLAIDDLMQYLVRVLELPGLKNQIFEIGGPDRISYAGLMREYARQRGLRRWISTPKGGIRGLWDADTDQIIFGSQQIAYRVGSQPTIFPQRITRELTFLPYAQIAEFELDDTVRVTEAFYVPHGPKHDRVVSFRRRHHDPQCRRGAGHGQGLSLGPAGRPALLRRTREGGPGQLRGRFRPQLR